MDHVTHRKGIRNLLDRFRDALVKALDALRMRNRAAVSPQDHQDRLANRTADAAERLANAMLMRHGHTDDTMLPGWTRSGPAIPVAPTHDNELSLAAGIADDSLDKRLLVHCLRAVPPNAWRPGGRCTITPTLRRIVHEWLWPPPATGGTGAADPGLWMPSRHAAELRQAMNSVTLAKLILPNRCRWRVVAFRVMPDFNDPDSRAVIEIAFPEPQDCVSPMDRSAPVPASPESRRGSRRCRAADR